MKKITTLLFISIIALVLAACGAQEVEPTQEPASIPGPAAPAESVEEAAQMKNIVEIAVDDGRFTTLVAALEAAGLVEALQGDGPFTVFAPTDDAFAALPDGTVEALLGDIDTLSSILLYHVVEGKVMAADVVGLDGQNVAALSGEDLMISVESGSVMINDSNVIITDIEASNGVIHVVDTVILPPAKEEAEMEPMMKSIVEIAVEDGRFTTLVAALEAADLVEALQGDGPFTVFAPTDDAFAALPDGTVEALLGDIDTLSSILLYHVVEGKVMAADVVGLDGQNVAALSGEDLMISVESGSVMINDSNVIITDIEASNGVIHVVDTVILPAKEEAEMEPMMKSIVEIAVEDGRFTTLVAALEAADLVEALQGDGPFTVFAPTDDAFAALPDGTVEALLGDIDTLSSILLYHVVEGKVMAADVVGLDGQNVAALSGEDLMISVESGSVMINDSNVIITDIEASNGVIHVVDTVILPPAKEEAEMEPMMKSIVEIAVEDGRFTTLVAALEAAGLVEALQGDGPFTVFAPTDDAFAALPDGTVEALLNDIDTLSSILLYHVVEGKVMAADVVSLDGESVETLSGETLSITVHGDVMVNDATVIITDIEAANGVIHVIDAVILPPG